MLFTHSPVFSVIAILLQMTGFVLMIKYYDKKPKLQDIQKWTDKYKIRYPEKYNPEILMQLEPTDMFSEIKSFYPVDKRFRRYWEIRRKSPLFLILFGLFLQIMPFVS
jgi:hypothetical protein